MDAIDHSPCGRDPSDSSHLKPILANEKSLYSSCESKLLLLSQTDYNDNRVSFIRDEPKSNFLCKTPNSPECNLLKKNDGVKRVPSILVQPNVKRKYGSEVEVGPTRETILDSQRNDKQIFNRNKRMLGLIIGTLEKFKSDEVDRERTTIKRSRIEEKLEQASTSTDSCDGLREVNSIKEASIDPKTDAKERHENWTSSHKYLCNYIQTKTEPKIFWIPRSQIPATDSRLRETRDTHETKIEARRAAFEKEMDNF